MAILHAFGGEKGGVGKSTFGKIVVQYFIDKQIPFVGFDTDRSAPDLRKAYKKRGIDIREAILSEASEHEDAAKVLFDTALEKTVLVNLSASSFEPLSAWIENNELLEIAREEDVKFYLWFVTDGSIESVKSLYKSLQAFGADIQHVIVKNVGRNTTGDWRLIDEDTKLQQLIEQYGAKELIFPKFFGNEEFKAIRDNSLGFREAIDSKNLGFGPIERQRVRKFLRESYEALESSGLLQSYLQPEPGTEANPAPELEAEANPALELETEVNPAPEPEPVKATATASAKTVKTATTQSRKRSSSAK